MSINTIAEILQDHNKNFSPITVDKNMTIAELTNKMIIENINSTIYVVDTNNKLIGALAQKHVAQHVFCDHIAPGSNLFPSSRIMNNLTEKYVKDIMDREFIYCTKDEKFDDVSAKLCAHKVFESIPVVDSEMHIIASIHILSLMQRHLELAKNTN